MELLRRWLIHDFVNQISNPDAPKLVAIDAKIVDISII
jgi:hypothetical protein